MSGKSNFFDYEPLSNSRRAQAPENEEFGVHKSVAVESDPEPIRHSAHNRTKAVPGKDNDTEVVPAKSTPLARMPLVGGHGLSFIGLFLFTMLVFFRPYEFSPSLAWLSKGALITALATLVIFVPTQLGLENRLTVRTREVNLVLLLLLLCLVSVPFALDKLRAWNNFVDFLKVVVMFVVIVNVIRTEKRLKALLLLILVASIILCVAAVNDYWMGNLALNGQRIEGAIGSLFDNPNDLALHLVTVFPIVIGLALGSRTLAAKIIYLGVAVCILGGTVVTFSRAGFLGLIFVFGTLAWKLGRKNRFLVGIISVALITLFVVLAPGAYRQRVTTTVDESSLSRTGELKRSIFLTVRNPVFGVGMGNFILFSDREHATHNSYTQVAAEIGLPATVVYILFLVAALRRMRRMPQPYEVEKRKRAIPYLAVGLEASLVGYMVVSFFASVAFLWYAYYLVGYAVCLSRLYDDSQVRQGAVVERRAG